MKRIYLDHNATTPLSPSVLEAMLPFMRQDFGNPSSIHWFGQQARRAVDRARQQVAAFMGASPMEIVFTGSGTEADNHALRGVVAAQQGKASQIITTAVEHPAVLNTCKALQQEGVEVVHLPVDHHGRVDPSQAAEAIKERTALVSVMLANNDTGTLQPVAQVAQATRERGVPLHSDAIQAASKVPLDVGALGVDLLSISGHKICGPKGCGALYVRRGTRIEPLLFGGGHEGGRRAGTENVAAIVGLGQACEEAAQDMESHAAREAALLDRLQAGITRLIDGATINGHPRHRLPNTLNVGFACIEAEALLMNLDLRGIAVSAGSACSAGTLEPSHVLTAMGLPLEQGMSAIRLSLGRDNTEEDVDLTVAALAELVEKLRQTSPL